MIKMAVKQNGDEEEFLRKVDEIETIVKGLTSNNENQVQDAMVKADQIISAKHCRPSSKEDEEQHMMKTTIGFSKTMINKNVPSSNVPTNTHSQDPGNQKVFMEMMEADAKQRCEQRRMREQEADYFKLAGNVAFKENDYVKALQFYNQAIEKIMDNATLYTNRAQTHIKMGNYDNALKDCEWAIRVDPVYIKAYIHMGRAHLAAGHMEEARLAYLQVLDFEPSKDSIVQAYLAEVKRAELKECGELEARRMLTNGDTSAQRVVHILTKIAERDHPSLFYSGGFRALSGLLNTVHNQTQFRLHGGLQLFHEHHLLHSSCLKSADNLSEEHLDVLSTAVDMMAAACQNNNMNQEDFLKCHGTAKSLLFILTATFNISDQALRFAVINLFLSMARVEVGRRLLFQHVDADRLSAALFGLAKRESENSEPIVELISVLLLDRMFRRTVMKRFEDVLSSFEMMLSNVPCKDKLFLLCITSLNHLACDKEFRRMMSERRQLWLVVEELLAHNAASFSTEYFESVMKLMISVSHQPSDILSEIGHCVCNTCFTFLPDNYPSDGLDCVGQRVLIVIGNIVHHSPTAAEMVIGRGGATLFLGYVKASKSVTMKHSLKILTALTQLSKRVCEEVVRNDGIKTVVRLLGEKDEGIVGNAALCLSHCTKVRGACAAMVNTEVVKESLIWARDGKNVSAQKNCAILLGKLATGHKKHVDRLRQLDGMGILHNCMKLFSE